MCGEKTREVGKAGSFEGSPPRVRGKAVIAARTGRTVRITPACAGKSCTELTVKGEMKDHPRVCGEKLSRNLKQQVPHRITPACAGKRTYFWMGTCSTQDHPRVCGEKPNPAC